MYSFFTRNWYKYIYGEMKECLPKAYSLKLFNSDYLTRSNTNIFCKIIHGNDSYNLDEILISRFEAYLERKKDYINRYSELEKLFGNYEKLDELEEYDIELSKYKCKLDSFVEVTKRKLEEVIEKLANNNISVEIILDDEEFLLLGLNVLKVELRKKYMEVKKIYRENLFKYDNLTENELDNIDPFITKKTRIVDVCQLQN